MAVDLQDLMNQDPTEVESGGLLAEGWYYVECKDINEDGDTWVLKFEIISKDFKGRTFDEKLWGADTNDPDKVKKALQRKSMWLSRLGVFEKNEDGDGYHWAEGCKSTVDVIGRKAIVRMIRKKDPKTKEYSQYVNVGYADIYPVGDKRVPKEVQDALLGGESVASDAAAGKPAKKSKDIDASDL